MVTTGHLLLDQETRNITHLKGTSSGQKPLFWKKRWILVLKYMCCFTFLFWILFCNDVFGKQTVCIYFAWKSVDKKTQSLYCTGTIVTFIEHLLCAKGLFWASLHISITLWSKCHSYFLAIEGSYGIWTQSQALCRTAQDIRNLRMMKTFCQHAAAVETKSLWRRQ